MSKAYFLTENDRRKIKRLLSTVQQPSGLSTSLSSSSSDIYVGRLIDGIGVMTEKSSEESYDHPACAKCRIYQIVWNSGIEKWDLVPISSDEINVFNISLNLNRPQDAWVIVVRSKFGQWLAINIYEDVYNSYFKIVDISTESTLEVMVVDGLTWDFEAQTSDDSFAKVNYSAGYDVAAWKSGALTETKCIVLHWKAPEGETPSSMTLELKDSYQSSTSSDLYHPIGRAIITDGALTIEQQHKSGIAELWWGVVCGACEEEV